MAKDNRDTAKHTQQVLMGNFDNPVPKREKVSREDASERYLKKPTPSEDFNELNMNYPNPSFKKKVVHEDD